MAVRAACEKVQCA